MKRLIRSCSTALLPALFITLAPVAVHAQAADAEAVLAQESFLRPPQDVAEAVLAPRHLNVSLGNPSPDGSLFLHERSGGLPQMASFAKPFYRLGGLQVDIRGNRARQMTVRGDAGFELIEWRTGRRINVTAPEGATVSSPQWSPDGSRIAFFANFADATHVYVADASNGRTRQVTRSPVLATLNTDIEWTPDGRSIVVVLLPQNRGAEPAAAAVPTAPQVRLTTPEKNRLRTYPSLLQNPHEKNLLEYYTTGQLAVVDVQSRSERRIGQPAMIRSVDVAPGGGHARVSIMTKPFSYIVPVSSFGSVDQVWSLADGAMLAQVAEEKMTEGAPADTTDRNEADPEKRALTWRPDGAGLSFLQQEPRQPGDTASADAAAEQGGQNNRSRRKDRVMLWRVPFDASSMDVVYESDNRLSSVRYSEDAQILFLVEQQGQNRHEYAVFLSDPSTKHTITRGRASGGFGGFGGGGGSDDGSLVTKTLPTGGSVVQLSSDGNHVFLSGIDNHDDPMAEGPQSFIDRFEIRTGEKTRIYESENDGVFERVVEVMDDDATELIVTREGPTDVPDSFYRDVDSGELRQITENVDYTPDLTAAKRQRYQVTRADGFTFAVDVTLPQDWQPGTRLPGMIWFYPREYTDQGDYDETLEDYNKNRFPNIGTRSMEILVKEGYAVIQPDAPIFGEEGRMNDNYVPDLRNNLAAVIDFLDAEGVIDRQRLGVGGHSYGAFSTMNAMVHTPFFKAGIAGDGNYNRTLTPLAFQSERRSIWDDLDLYVDMSPLLHADNLTGAILLYHGEHDQNVGTFPIHSWRLFESLEFLGKTASMYVYPYEDHGPATQETLLDLWARWTAWLDKYVKNAGQQAEKVTTQEDAGN